MIATIAFLLTAIQGVVLADLVTKTNGWDDSTLIFATIVYRHGDRTPIKPYPKDPFGREHWSVDWGQLTNVSIK